MAHKPLKLSVPNPCQKPWREMTTVETGRFCDSCQKTVVNFVGMSDQEIVAYFSTAQNRVCGRFGAGQLNRHLSSSITGTGSTGKQRWLGLITAGLMSWSTAHGQGDRLSGKSDLLPELVRPELIASTVDQPLVVAVAGDALRVIEGQVVDATSNQPIQGATVVLKGTNRGIATDTVGRFKLSLTDHTPDKVVLSISLVGFMTQEITMTADMSRPLVVRLAEDTQMLGEVVYTGYAVVKKKPTFFQRLRHLFRHSH